MIIGANVQLRGEGARAPGHREVALDSEAPVPVNHPHGAGAESDRLPVQGLVVDVLADLAAILIREGLDAPQALTHLQRTRVGAQLDR
jgi:hypothetical protein